MMCSWICSEVIPDETGESTVEAEPKKNSLQKTEEAVPSKPKKVYTAPFIPQDE